MKHAGTSFRRIFSALLIAVLLLGASMPALAAKNGDILRVSEDFARLRSKPQSGSDILTKLRRGTKVIYLGERNGWVRLELANGKTGFMYKSMLTSYSAPKVGKLYRSRLHSNRLPVFIKPNAKAKKAGSLKNTTTVVLLARKGTWGKIRVVKSGAVGYVNLKYLKPSK